MRIAGLILLALLSVDVRAESPATRSAVQSQFETEIVIVRHGMKKTDGTLSEEGKQWAIQLGKSLKGAGVQYIVYTNDNARMRQTAEAAQNGMLDGDKKPALHPMNGVPTLKDLNNGKDNVLVVLHHHDIKNVVTDLVDKLHADGFKGDNEEFVKKATDGEKIYDYVIYLRKDFKAVWHLTIDLEAPAAKQ